jgi:hypothetical protein
MHRSVALLVLLSAWSSVFASQNATVTLRIEPDQFLVGLDPMASITVANIGTEPLQLTGAMRVHASSPDGTQFVLQRHSGEDTVADQYVFARSTDQQLQILPNGTQTFFLRSGLTRSDSGFFRPSFLDDNHFDNAGTYSLVAELLTRNPALSFLSDQVTVKVVAPQGRDASALAAAGAITGQGEESNSSISRLFMTTFADSAYAPYWVVYLRTTDEALRLSLYNDAIRRTPEGYATELKLALLRLEGESLMGEAIANFDLPSALSYREKAKALAEDLAKSRFPYASTAGTAALDDLPTPEQLQSQYNDRIQRFSAASGVVVPYVQCVDRGVSKDDPMITVFGYDSANTIGKYIAPGAANRLRPDDAVAVLPVYFGPGHIPRVGAPYPFVVVTRHDAAPSWTLDGGVATVATATPACETLQPVAAPVTPLFDCLSGNDGGNLTAEFGYINPNPIPLRIPNGPANVIVGKGNPPSVFLPGEHHNVFVIKGKKEDKKDTTPAWTLQGRTDTATPNAIQCAAGRGGEN